MTTFAQPSDTQRRTELSAFLRNRRERLQPDDVGLPGGGRRRTPGLRREEVAQLAGVGVTWYTWLEQGRQINVSTQVLDAIARTLRLDRHERAHLDTLAGVLSPRAAIECNALPPQAQTLLDQLAPFPAVITNDRHDMLAYNNTFRHFILDLDEIPPDQRNTIWLAFTNEEWQRGVVDFEDVAGRLVASYRAAMPNHLGEPAWLSLGEELRRRSPLFESLWGRHDVATFVSPVKLLRSPQVGLLRLGMSTLWLSQSGRAKMTVYSPLDDECRAKLERLTELHSHHPVDG